MVFLDAVVAALLLLLHCADTGYGSDAPSNCVYSGTAFGGPYPSPVQFRSCERDVSGLQCKMLATSGGHYSETSQIQQSACDNRTEI